MTLAAIEAIKVYNLLAGGQVLITWAPTQDDAAVGYKVYRSGSPTSDFEFLAAVTPPVTSYQYQVPWSFGIVYYYKVTSVDVDDNESPIDQTHAAWEGTYHSFEEQPFPTTITSQSLISGEVPGGLVNTSNTLYTTLYPYQPTSVKLYANGVRLTRGVDFTEGPQQQQITTTAAPATGVKLRVDYTRYV